MRGDGFTYFLVMLTNSSRRAKREEVNASIFVVNVQLLNVLIRLRVPLVLSLFSASYSIPYTVLLLLWGGLFGAIHTGVSDPFNPALDNVGVDIPGGSLIV